jgi:hypothetical protein
MVKIIKLYCNNGLGDNIFNCILFYNIKDYIEKNDIVIEYTCLYDYHFTISEFIISKNIILKKLENDNTDYGQRMWFNNTEYQIYNYSDIPLDKYIISYYNSFLNKNDIPIQIENFEYDDPELLIRRQKIEELYGNKYNNIDFLIINSKPQSGQFTYNEEKWNSFIDSMNDRYKIVITTNCPNKSVVCTMDDNLSVKDIAAISTKVPQIIVVNSGVITGLFNKYTLNNIEKLYYFVDNTSYSLPNFIRKKDIDELNFLLDENSPSVEAFSNHSIPLYNFFLIVIIIFLLFLLLYKFGFSKKYLRSIRR